MKKWFSGSVATVAAAALVVLPIAPAHAANTISESEGKFLSGQVLGFDLDTIASVYSSFANHPNGPGPYGGNNKIDAQVLNALPVKLGPLLNNLNLFGDTGIIQLGAVSQYSQAEPNGDARAAAGAAGNQGGIGINPPPAGTTGVADAHVDLGPILNTIGPAATSVLSKARIDTGALASYAEQISGTVKSKYLVDGLKAQVTSPLVGGLYTGIKSGVLGGPVKDLLTGIQNLVKALKVDLLGLVSVDLDVQLPADLGQLLPTGPLTGGIDRGITVNLATGEVVIDVKKILSSNNPSIDLNDLPPNSPALSGPLVGAAITTALTQTLIGVVNSTVQHAVDTLFAQTRIVGKVSALGINLNADVSFQGILDGKPLITSNNPLLNFVVGAVGGLVSGTLKPALALLKGNLLGTILGGLQSVIDGLTVNVVQPVVNLLDQIAAIHVNVQPTAPTANQPFTVRALQIGLGLPGVPLATVNLANSTVQGTVTPVYTPVISASPSSVPRGGTTTLSGTGFAPNDIVTLTLAAANGQPATTVSTEADASGTIEPVDLTVPADYPLGTAVITGHGSATNIPVDPTVNITVL